MQPSVVTISVIEDMVITASDCPQGCFVEIGVYKGGTAQYLLQEAKKQRREFYAYDTFFGLPYKCHLDPMNVGDFNDVDYEEIKTALPGAHVIQGIFPGSAIEMPPIAFVHLDVDQYQSVFESTIYLQDKMVSGGIIWFDDYGCLEGATAAVNQIYANKIEIAKCGKAFVRF